MGFLNEVTCDFLKEEVFGFVISIEVAEGRIAQYSPKQFEDEIAPILKEIRPNVSSVDIIVDAFKTANTDAERLVVVKKWMSFEEKRRIAETFSSAANLSFEHFSALLGWLNIDFEKIKSRLAPSLMARAESAFFGLSNRFAVRITWDSDPDNCQNGEGVICLRRGSMIVQQMGRIIRSENLQKYKCLDQYIVDKESLLVQPTVIGDCFLPVPTGYEDFEIITTELNNAYGEPSDKDATDQTIPLKGTPYVQHYWTSGLCGHAVAFIASAALKKYVENIWTMAEIAVILRDSKSDYIEVAGLTPQQLMRFFAHDDVRLRVSDQHVLDTDKRITISMRSYIKSGMPIILYMDQLKMAEPHGIYSNLSPRDHRLQNISQEDIPQKMPHAVIVLGCSKSPTSEEFIIHDSARLPYIPVTKKQLVEASLIEPAIGTEKNFFSFFPVTPSAVKMPLLKSKEIDNNGQTKIRFGLYDIATALSADAAADIEKWSYITEKLLGVEKIGTIEFRLIQASQLSNKIKQQYTNGIEFKEFEEWVNAIKHKKGDDGWIWIQVQSASAGEFVWIWDAEIEPPYIDDVINGTVRPNFEQYCLGGSAIGGGEKFRFSCFNLPSVSSVSISRSNPPETEKDTETLDLSLITSFYTQSPLGSFNYWPNDILSAELYTFMRNGLSDLFDQYYIKNETVVETLSDVYKSSNKNAAIALVGDKIDNATSIPKNNVNIRSFATFIPELLASESSQREIGVNALCFLYELGEYLLTKGHKIDTIEIVGGSRIDAVMPIQPLQVSSTLVPKTIAFPIDTDQAIENLKFSLNEIQAMGCYGKSDIRLAIELEPGNLFSLSTKDDMEKFVALFKALPILGFAPEKIGFNLDVGHWILAGLKASDVANYKDYIFSSHLSDNEKAHFGDAVIGSCHDDNKLIEWVKALKQLPTTYNRRLNIEFEGARDSAMLQKCIDAAKRLI